MTNIEFTVEPSRLYEESNQMIRLVAKMRENMETARQIMNATGNYWRGDAGELHRRLFIEQEANVEKAMNNLEARGNDLAEIAGNYLTEEYRNTIVSDSLPSDAIV